MRIVVMIAVVVIGTALWLWLLRRYDKVEPESIRHLLQVLVFGGLMSVAAAALFNSIAAGYFGIDVFEGGGAHSLWVLFFFSLFIGFNEEICKATAGVFVTRRWGDFDEPVDAMIYAMTVGLGFAAFENMLYAIRFGNEVLFMRFLWPVPAHMAYAALWGYGLAKARYVYPNRSRFRVMAPPVIVASIVHGVANYLLFLQDPLTAIFSLCVLFVLVYLAHYRLQQLVAESPYLRPGQCPNCLHRNSPSALECIECGVSLQQADMFQSCPCGKIRIPVSHKRCPSCGMSA